MKCDWIVFQKRGVLVCQNRPHFRRPRVSVPSCPLYEVSCRVRLTSSTSLHVSEIQIVFDKRERIRREAMYKLSVSISKINIQETRKEREKENQVFRPHKLPDFLVKNSNPV